MVYIVLILGFVLLIKGADFFVDGSSNVAKILRIPPIIIGLTVVAFGTSLPEASVSITAAFQGKNDLAVSNVIGSNIFNLLVVLGASAIVRPVYAKASVLKNEFPFSIFITMALLVCLCLPVLFTGRGEFILGRGEGLVLLGLFALFLASTVRQALKSRREEQIEHGKNKTISPIKSTVLILIGIAGIVIGGGWVVDSASEIARSFHLSETFIGLTIVALGTSLPELVTSMVAAKKGENDLAVGNVVGSNIFNILLILGASGALAPISVELTAIYDTMVLITASVLVYICALKGKSVSRGEGGMFLLGYAGYFVYILLR